MQSKKFFGNRFDRGKALATVFVTIARGSNLKIDFWLKIKFLDILIGKPVI